MKNLVLLMIVLALCTHCTRGSPPSKTAGKNQTIAKETPQSPNTTDAQEQDNKNLTAGVESEALRVYIDPETGEFTAPPEQENAAARKQALPEAFSTSQEGLEEKPSPVPGGGTMVDLKGRFRSPLVATTDSNGKIKIEHQAPDK
jgi:hypothetical protein